MAPVAFGCIFFILGVIALFVSYSTGRISWHLATFQWLTSKGGLGALALVNFAAIAFVVTWLLTAGLTSQYETMRLFARMLDRLLRLRPLTLLGQHSLLVFTYHVVGLYLFYVLVDTRGFDAWDGNLILLLGLLSLSLPVAVGRYLKDRKRQILYPAPAR